MKKMKLILLLLWSLAFAKMVSAQTVVSAGGGVKQVGSITIAYTIGQPTIASGSFASGNVRIVTGGFEQPEFFSSVETFEIDGKKVVITVFPNPASNWLIVKNEGVEDKNIKLQLINSQGIPLQTMSFDKEQIEFNLQDYPQSYYFLQLINMKNEVLRSFKIVKQ